MTKGKTWFVVLIVMLGSCCWARGEAEEEWTFALRILADRQTDLNVVSTGELTQGQDVYVNGSVMARWVPIAADANDVDVPLSAVTRINSDMGTEVLVLIGWGDFTQDHIESMILAPATNSRGVSLLINATEAGRGVMAAQTRAHSDRFAAMVCDGKIARITETGSIINGRLRVPLAGPLRQYPNILRHLTSEIIPWSYARILLIRQIYVFAATLSWGIVLVIVGKIRKRRLGWRVSIAVLLGGVLSGNLFLYITTGSRSGTLRVLLDYINQVKINFLHPYFQIYLFYLLGSLVGVLFALATVRVFCAREEPVQAIAQT
ncbi:MAG: hypothetical protein JW936_08360 [Sedimentisphaerales bacterium]|nr:hypothetical protein [Sedimentisphaerales bacterium]